jgi:hypothetical protein
LSLIDLNQGGDSVSVAFEEVSVRDRAEKVYRPDIERPPQRIHKKHGYAM